MTAMKNQRIIGFVLLLSVIFGVAMLLIRSAHHGAERDNPEQSLDLRIDTHDDNMSTTVVSDFETHVLIEQPNDEAKVTNDIAIEVINTIPAPAPAPAPAPVVKDVSVDMWVIQLASFSLRSNADTLSLKVKKMGYKPVIESSHGRNGKVYRVRLVPMADKKHAQSIANKLNQKLKLSTQVLHAQP